MFIVRLELGLCILTNRELLQLTSTEFGKAIELISIKRNAVCNYIIYNTFKIIFIHITYI